MLRIFFKSLFRKRLRVSLVLLVTGLIFAACGSHGSKMQRAELSHPVAQQIQMNQMKQSKLHQPLKELFSHRNHEMAFGKASISCLRCHNFSTKSTEQDPLSEGVSAGKILPQAHICHECHQGKVQMPRPQQCTLCHLDVKSLEPKNHNRNWRHRHGFEAQFDQDSCLQCHVQGTCNECHMQRDKIKPKVHRPNFRSFHSIEARQNPQSCVSCHATNSTCLDCHTKGFK